MLKKLSLTMVVLSLAGCAFAPGMRMDSPPNDVRKESEQLQIKPTFVPITPELLASMPETKRDNY